MTYTIVLILSILIYLFDYGYYQHKNRNLAGRTSMNVFAFILFIMAAIRYENEYLSDFAINYRRIIQAKQMAWIDCLTSGVAVGNALFRKIVAEVFGNPQWYFILTAFIIVYCTVHVIKRYSPSLFLPIFLFYTIGAYFTSNNVTRQAMAVAITMLSWKYIFDRKLLKFVLVVFLASTIHISAVFFLPMYFLSDVKLGRNQYIFYLLFGLAIFVARNPIIHFFQRLVFSNYTETSYGMTGSNQLRLILTGVIAVYLYFYSKNYENVRELAQDKMIEGNSVLFTNFLGHSTVINILFSIFSVTNMLLLSRMAMYWSFQSILCIVYATKTNGKRNRLILTAIIIAAAIIWFMAMEITGKHIPTPYTPFWMIPDRPSI